MFDKDNKFGFINNNENNNNNIEGLDNIKTDIKNIKNDVGELNTQYKDIANKTITTEERTKLTNLKNYDDTSIKSDIQSQKTRIDNLAKLQAGSTTGDAELIDGRVGADGITYDNIGGAIRGQVNSITENINDLGLFKNKVIFTFEKNQSIGYLKGDGEIIKENNMVCFYTNAIDCAPGDIFLYKGYGSANAISYIFKMDNTIISSGKYDSKTKYTEITIPSGVNKVIFSSFNYSANYNEIVFDVKLKNATLEEKVNNTETKNNKIQADLEILSAGCTKAVIQNYTTTKHWLNNDGGRVADTISTCTDYITCNEEDKFYVTGHTQYETRLVATYDKNKQFLRVYGYDPKKRVLIMLTLNLCQKMMKSL